MKPGTTAQQHALAVKVGRKLRKFHEENPEVTAAPLRKEDTHLDSLFLAVDFIDSKLPGMAQELYDAFEGPLTPVKDKTAIFKVFAAFAMTESRIARGLGLVKEAAAQEGGLSINTLLNINLPGLRELPSKKITARLLESEEEE